MKKKFDDENFYKIQKFEINNRDLTGEVIGEKMKHLEIVSNELIKFALWRLRENFDEKEKILEETLNYMDVRIGQGSIGPATAAASPLLEDKKKELKKYFKNY
ncbi:MAG: hypothetical protein ACTSQJ_08865 [Promethearchaeota archaeon]